MTDSKTKSANKGKLTISKADIGSLKGGQVICSPPDGGKSRCICDVTAKGSTTNTRDGFKR